METDNQQALCLDPSEGGERACAGTAQGHQPTLLRRDHVSSAHRDRTDAAWATIEPELEHLAPFMPPLGLDPTDWADIEGIVFTLDAIELVAPWYQDRYDTPVLRLVAVATKIADVIEACHDECGCAACIAMREVDGLLR